MIKKGIEKSIEESSKNVSEYPKEASPEAFGKLAERIERQRQMTGGPSSWDTMKITAKTPEEKREIRRIIKENYDKNGSKNMSEKDLVWIGKARSQTSPEIKVPSVNLNLINTDPEPQIPIEHKIKIMADQRLQEQQDEWDKRVGRGGITEMLRPKK
jgi:hypothetical protein